MNDNDIYIIYTLISRYCPSSTPFHLALHGDGRLRHVGGQDHAPAAGHGAHGVVLRRGVQSAV